MIGVISLVGKDCGRSGDAISGIDVLQIARAITHIHGGSRSDGTCYGVVPDPWRWLPNEES